MNFYKQTECPKRIAVAVLSFSSTLWVDLFKPSSLHPHCHPLSVRLESCMTGNGGQSLETQLHWPRMDLQYFDPLHLWNHLTHWDTPSCHPPTPPSVCLLTFTHCVAFTHKQLLYLLCRFEWWSLNPYLVFPLPLAFCFAPKCGRTIKLMDISLEVYTDQVRDSRSCWL